MEGLLSKGPTLSSFHRSSSSFSLHVFPITAGAGASKLCSSNWSPLKIGAYRQFLMCQQSGSGPALLLEMEVKTETDDQGDEQKDT